MALDWLVVGVFVVVYLGMALGRWPGLAIDRTGVAVIGAIVLLVSGVVDGRTAVRFIDFPTIAVLFALMVISAQFAASGFFDWLGARIARGGGAGGKRLLFHVVVAGGVLASVLTNDVVVWALTPVLVHGLLRGGVNPRPYVIALACAANAGSAATVIGNPQNLLIGGHGNLGFWHFLLVCGVPAVLALAVVFGVVALSRHGVASRPAAAAADPSSLPQSPALNRSALTKAAVATVALVIIFSVAEDRATWALAIVGVLLLSRKLDTRRMLSMVDWHLLLLFGGLFVVTGAFSGEAGLIAGRLADIAAGGGQGKAALGLIALAGSNTIGNVPLVVFLLSVVPHWAASSLYALALFSTLSGNFLIVGSVANIIAVERAKAFGVSIGFADYARLGVPITLLSLLVAYAWVHLVSPLLVAAVGG